MPASAALAPEPERSVRKDVLDRLIFETLVTEISAGFVNVPADQVDAEIEAAQKGICECLGLEHSSLWQVDPANPEKITLTHYYRDPSLPGPLEHMDGAELFPWILGKLERGEVVCLPDVSQTPPEAQVDRQSWEYFHIKSTLGFPLSLGGGALFGVLSFEATRAAREWPEVLVQRLQLIAGVIANAIQRKNSEQRLRESEARLSLAAHSANAGLWSLDTTTGTLWATAAARRLFGVEPGQHFDFAAVLSMIHPADRSAVETAIHAAMLADEEASIEYRVVRPDGTQHWMVSRGRRYCHANETSHIIMGVTIEITELKRAEKERAELAGRLLNAQEVERTRIARELHDDLGQRLALLDMQLQKTSSAIKRPSQETTAGLQELRNKIRELAQRVSVLSHELHSSELEFLGLVAAGKALCREVSEQHGVSVKCSCRLESKLDNSVETCVYRVLQEALNNAVRHGQAKKIDVTMEEKDRTVHLRIADSGVGFDTEAPRTRRGLGLVSMRERARLLGGDCTVESQPGLGTVVHAVVPLV